MAKYKKCSRCELNWIPVEEDYCDVCKAELKIGGATLLEDEDEDEMLCPVCHTNYLEPGEKICAECARKTGKNGADEEYEKDDQPEEDDENKVSFDELAEEEAWNDFDEPFDDNEDFDSDDYGDAFDDEEESDEEEEEYKDDLDDDFNYDISDVADDEEEEVEETPGDDDDDI